LNLFPVLERELRSQARQGATFWSRLLAGGLLIAMFGLGTGLGNQAVGPSLGRDLFLALNGVAYYILWLGVPMLAADSISREKREGTLGLLFLTPLSATDLVAGKGLILGLRGLNCVRESRCRRVGESVSVEPGHTVVAFVDLVARHRESDTLAGELRILVTLRRRQLKPFVGLDAAFRCVLAPGIHTGPVALLSQGVLTSRISMLGSPEHPDGRVDRVSRLPLAAGEHDREIVLCQRVILVGSKAIPARRLGKIARWARGNRVVDREGELGLRVALFGPGLQFWQARRALGDVGFIGVTGNHDRQLAVLAPKHKSFLELASDAGRTRVKPWAAGAGIAVEGCISRFPERGCSCPLRC
jgi:hypothetical protein